MTLGIILGSCCNLSCRYCYQKADTKNQFEEYTNTEQEENILNFIKAVYDKENHLHIDLQESNTLFLIGGEPFVYIRLVNKITEWYIGILENCDYVNKDTINIFITTNGTLLHIPAVRVYLEKYGHYISLSISFDCVKEAQDKNRLDKHNNSTYDIVYSNYKQYGLPYVNKLRIGALICYNTVQYTFDIIKFLMEEEVYHVLRLIHTIEPLDIDKSVYSEQLSLLINWYTNKPDDWILSHNIYNNTKVFKPQFLQDMEEKRFNNSYDKWITLEPNGDVYKNSLNYNALPEDNRKLGNIKQLDRLDWSIVFDESFLFDKKVYNKTSPCYRCALGGINNTCFAGYDKRRCAIVAFYYSIILFLNAYKLKILQRHGLSLDKHFDLALPKNFALDIMSEQQYSYMCDLIKEINGNITPLEGQFYTDNQMAVIIEEYKRLYNE